MSYSTVKTHVSHLLTKLMRANRAQLAMLAHLGGLGGLSARVGVVMSSVMRSSASGIPASPAVDPRGEGRCTAPCCRMEGCGCATES